jgi:heptosyltransferase-2
MTQKHDPDPNRQILIRSTNWIGDVVMSLPAIREIRKLNPEARITVLANDWVSEIYRGQKLVDELICFQKGENSLKLAPTLRHYHQAILFQNAFEAAFLAFLARIPNRYGYSIQGRGFLLTHKAIPRIKELRRHQVYYYLDLLFQTGISNHDYLEDPGFQPNISLTPTSTGIQKAKLLMETEGLDSRQPIVGLNPGAYFGPAKRWFIERYAELADLLIRKFAVQVVIFGSGGEIHIAEEIRRKMKKSAIILAGKTDLSCLISMIAKCSLFVTNDSGPMHLGASLEIPMIALFGSTDEVATGPFSENAAVIHKHVECSPCLKRECPIDLRCFREIKVDEVFEKASRILSRKN